MLGYASGVDLSSNGTTTIDGGNFRFNGVGINIHSRNSGNANRPTVNITGARVEDNQVGIHVDSSVVQRRGTILRNSIVLNNEIGIEISRGINVGGLFGCFIACLDMGRVGDPGSNTIINNTTTGVFVDFGAIAFASGNTWNPNTQAANPSGTYPLGFEVRGDRSDALIHGANFFLNGFDSRGALTAIQF